ncbi:MAG: carboxypeptidase-like regulatory domain-containing protein [Thermoanaerobaculia bacterium]|jgi:hypothetical protein
MRSVVRSVLFCAVVTNGLGATEVSGVVRHGTGPLPGVVVTASDHASLKLEVISGLDGRYALSLPGDGPYVIRAKMEGMAVATKQICPTEPAVECDFWMNLSKVSDFLVPLGGEPATVPEPTKRTIQGRLLVPADAPVPSTFVQLAGEPLMGFTTDAAGNVSRSELRPAAKVTLASDAAGNFAGEIAAFGEVTLSVVAPGYQEERIRLESDLVTARIELLLTPACASSSAPN